MWGKVSCIERGDKVNGITPHVCGEKKEKNSLTTNSRGSPPRVWGKVDTCNSPSLRYWITPTCVGKRAKSTSSRLLRRDHPHVCGEKFGTLIIAVLDTGSPPRVWGKDVWQTAYGDSRRITPTCVGKRFSISGYNSSVRDHPHVCGEK